MARLLAGLDGPASLLLQFLDQLRDDLEQVADDGEPGTPDGVDTELTQDARVSQIPSFSSATVQIGYNVNSIQFA